MSNDMSGNFTEGLSPGDSQQPPTSDPREFFPSRFYPLSPMGSQLNAGATYPLLSDEEQSIMIQSISNLFELEEEPVDEDEMEDVDDGGEAVVVDLEDQQRRTERLKSAMTTLS